MSIRLELAEREVSLSQSALDRRDNLFHIWTNDPYWYRRLEKVGAVLVKETVTSREYTVESRQILIRRVPAKREGHSQAGEYFKQKALEAASAKDSALPLQ